MAARAALDRGMRVSAVETSAERRAIIESPAASDDVLAALFEHRARGAFDVSSRPAGGEYHATLLCVPTRGGDGAFDPGALLAALAEVGPHITDGEVIAIESTVPPFTTDHILKPALERESGRIVGRDVYLVHAPERYNSPGAIEYGQIARIVGGSTPACTAAGVALYREIVSEVHPVSSALVAECAKLLEQAFRFVNVTFANEFSVTAANWGVDPREVVAAAATKPFGFMPFWPSLGVGGHCVPASSRFLADAIGRSGMTANILSAAFAADEQLPSLIAATFGLAQEARVLILGAAYKTGASGTIESPSLRLAHHLSALGVDVDVCDPHPPIGECVFRVRRPDEIEGDYSAAVISAWAPEFEPLLARLNGTRLFDLRGCAAPAEESAPISI